MTVTVTFAAPLGSIGAALFRNACLLVLHGEKKRDASISIVLLDDVAMARLNETFLSHTGPTDVITFPLGDGPAPEAEIYISTDTARSQAREFGVPLREELARLAIHGTLHACGYDDLAEPARSRMLRRQEKYVTQLFAR